MSANLIKDYEDYGSVGDFVVRKHKTDATKAYVMCMKTGDVWEREDLSDALHFARDKFYDSMREK